MKPSLNVKRPQITIKKYTNRKLYDCESRKYINLRDVAQYVEDDCEFEIIDHKTQKDITTKVLTEMVLLRELEKETPTLAAEELREILKNDKSLSVTSTRAKNTVFEESNEIGW